MGNVIDMPTGRPSAPLRCEDPECRKTTFFVYYDGHIRCSSCGMVYLLSPIDSMSLSDEDEELEILFEPDPSILSDSPKS